MFGNMPRRLLLAEMVAALLLAPAVVAQTWAATATAPVPGSATATINSNFAPPVVVTTPLPVGPVAAGTYLSVYASLAPGGSFARTHAQWAPTFATLAGPVGFEAIGFNWVQAQPPPGMTQVASQCQLGAVLRVTLQAPSPTSGRLAIQYLGIESDMGNARIDVDVGDDGSIDLIADNQTFQSSDTWRVFNMPLHIGATGVPIRLVISSQNGVGAWGASWQQHAASITVRAHFLPGQPTVQPFDQTGASVSLFGQQSLSNIVTLQVYAPNLTWPAVYAFGMQPMVAPIPGLPTVTQLLTIDTFAVANFLVLPMPVLPPGTSLYCQALALDANGTLRSSNSLRATWP
jgi:hypothetical protein